MLLYIDNILIAPKSKVEIKELNVQLKRKFEMKNIGEEKKILKMEVEG